MKQWRFWLGVLISVVCLILVLWRIDYREVLNALAQANYAWLIPAALPFAATIACKVLRWQVWSTICLRVEQQASLCMGRGEGDAGFQQITE